MKHLYTLPLLALALTACSGPPAQDDFVTNLMPLCGQSYTGAVVSTDAADADWRSEEIIVGPIACAVADIRMPLAVGENTSRTWVLIPEKRTLTLKHDHRHDGKPDAVSWYGGTTRTDGSAARQEFPVDDFSIELFKKEGLPASVVNTWAMEIDSGETLAYELSRPATDEQIAAGEPGRFFRIEFDINEPLLPNMTAGPTLRFHWVADEPSADTIEVETFHFQDDSKSLLPLKIPAFMDETCLKNVEVGQHSVSGSAVLNFKLIDKCARIFGDQTARNVGKRMAVVLNGKVNTALRINGPITGGSGFLEFGGSSAEVKEIADSFNLPAAK